MQVYLDQNQITKKRRNFRIKIYLSIFLIFLFFLTFLYILRYSQVFQVRNFNIFGDDQLSNESILNVLKPLVLNNRWEEFLGWQNLTVWNQNNFDLSKTALLTAEIDRDWLKLEVNIKVQERERLAIWCDKGQNCYWIDQEGTAFDSAPETEGSLILTINDLRDKNLIAGKKIMDSRFLPNAIKVLLGITELKIPVKKAIFDDKLQEIMVTTYSRPDLFFSIRFDPTLNLSSLRSLQEKGELQKAKYIDLRIENRIFYKNN